jgi:hypothetical protein
MAEQSQSELKVILRTVAQGAGAQQTSAALKQVGKDAQQVSHVGKAFSISGESALRFAGALAGVNVRVASRAPSARRRWRARNSRACWAASWRRHCWMPHAGKRH